MGWVPGEATTDDFVMVIRGFALPMLIRKTVRDTYRFMGVCYIDGFMDGETWEREDIESQSILVE